MNYIISGCHRYSYRSEGSQEEGQFVGLFKWLRLPMVNFGVSFLTIQDHGQVRLVPNTKQKKGYEKNASIAF
jgi:hypothetical protein